MEITLDLKKVEISRSIIEKASAFFDTGRIEDHIRFIDYTPSDDGEGCSCGGPIDVDG